MRSAVAAIAVAIFMMAGNVAVRTRALIAVLALAVGVFGHGVAAAQSDPFAAMNALRVEPPAAMPAVAFQTLDGQPASLKAFRGRPVLLTFFTTW